MTRQSWVQRVGPDGKSRFIPKHIAGTRPRPSVDFPMIMPDVAPYKSIITGEEISSRSQHRAHLAEHGCEEVGNEKPDWMREKHYVEAQGGTWGRPKPPEDEGVSFEWLDPEDA